MKIYRNPWKFTIKPKTLSISINIFWPTKLFPLSFCHVSSKRSLGFPDTRCWSRSGIHWQPQSSWTFAQNKRVMFLYFVKGGHLSHSAKKINDPHMTYQYDEDLFNKSYKNRYMMIEVESIGIFISPDHDWFFSFLLWWFIWTGVLYIPGATGCLPSTVLYENNGRWSTRPHILSPPPPPLLTLSLSHDRWKKVSKDCSASWSFSHSQVEIQDNLRWPFCFRAFVVFFGSGIIGGRMGSEFIILFSLHFRKPVYLHFCWSKFIWLQHWVFQVEQSNSLTWTCFFWLRGFTVSFLKITG